MIAQEVDLELALRTLHKLAQEDGDLGAAYWVSVSRLLKQASGIQTEINTLSRELEICRAKLDN